MLDDQVEAALAWLKSCSSEAIRDGMNRYAIASDHALGGAMKDIKALGKQLGHNQELAAALWKTGVYEARMLASFVGDPARITPAEMDEWCGDFDNWAFCDAMSFNLFDRTPCRWDKVAQWSRSDEEFVKRTAFALLWSLSVHDNDAGNERFAESLALIERAAADERNCQESREHGTSSHRKKESRAPRIRADGGGRPCGFQRPCGALDWQRCSAGTDKSIGASAAWACSVPKMTAVSGCETIIGG